jgi:hypothetical protein
MIGLGVGGIGVGGIAVQVGGTRVAVGRGSVTIGAGVRCDGACVGITIVGSATVGIAVGEAGARVETAVGVVGGLFRVLNSAAARWPVPGSMTVTSATGMRAQRGSYG